MTVTGIFKYMVKYILKCITESIIGYCSFVVHVNSLAHGNIYTKVLNEDKTDGAIKLKGRFIKTSENG